jgi:hypothetical protein
MATAILAIVYVSVSSASDFPFARRALLSSKISFSVIQRVKIRTIILVLALTRVLNLQFQILVVLHTLAFTLGYLVNLLLVHDLWDAIRTAHLLLNLKVSGVHALAATSLHSLVSRYQLLIIITGLFTNNLSEVFVRVEGSLMGLAIKTNELVARHLLCILQGHGVRGACSRQLLDLTSATDLMRLVLLGEVVAVALLLGGGAQVASSGTFTRRRSKAGRATVG